MSVAAESQSASDGNGKSRIAAPLFGGLVAIFIALAAGELLHAVGVPVPGSVIGMILLAVALAARVTRPERVRAASNILTRNMSLLFVPAGVGVMAYADTLAKAWLPIVLAIVASTTMVLVVTGPLQKMLHRRFGGASHAASPDEDLSGRNSGGTRGGRS